MNQQGNTVLLGGCILGFAMARRPPPPQASGKAFSESTLVDGVAVVFHGLPKADLPLGGACQASLACDQNTVAAGYNQNLEYIANVSPSN